MIQKLISSNVFLLFITFNCNETKTVLDVIVVRTSIYLFHTTRSVKLKQRQRDRETERQRDRETERQRDRETERQRDRETERQRERYNKRLREKETERKREKERQRDKETDRPKQTEIKIQTDEKRNIKIQTILL